jgi:uncharacterized membrane protein
MLILEILFVVSGLVLAGISIPLILGRIPPNGLYGFRVKKTMENPEIWYPVNTYAGKWLLVAGLSLPLAAVVLTFIPNLTLDIYSYTVLIWWVAIFTVAVVAILRYMKRF